MHEKRETKNKREDTIPKGAIPAYLLDRSINQLFHHSSSTSHSIDQSCPTGRASRELKFSVTWSNRREKRKP